MKILLDYSVKHGKYDSNEDVFQYEAETTDEVMKKAYEKALMVGTYLEDIPELQPLLEMAYREIKREQIEKFCLEGDDAFALNCLKESKSPFDCGYKITVSFADIEEVPDSGQIDEWHREALSTDDAELAEAIVLEHFADYSGKLFDKAMEIAEETGCREFTERNRHS